MEHARRIANATGVHRHVDDLLLDLDGVTRAWRCWGLGRLRQLLDL